MTVPGNNIIMQIERTPVDLEQIRQWEREYPFLKLATDLMGESAKYVCLLGSAFVGDRDDWSLEEAILGGHLVRMFKLIRHAIQQAKDKRAEMLWVSIRLISECTVNFRYLLANRRPEIFESFLQHSLQHEKELVEIIEANITERGGDVLPIEKRMLRSIENAFLNTEVMPDDLPQKRIRNWGNRNIRERARDIGLENAYLGVFGGPSASIHGGWGDFRQHHLEVVAPGRFRPKFDDARARPQPFLTLMTLMIIPGLIDYVGSLGVAETELIERRLGDLMERVSQVQDLHEEYLCRR